MEQESEKSLSKAETGVLSTRGKPTSIKLGMALISSTNVQCCISSPGKKGFKPPSHDLHPPHTPKAEMSAIAIMHRLSVN